MAYSGSSIRAVLLVFALIFCSSIGNAELNGTLWSNTTTNLSAGTSGKADVSDFSSKLLTTSTKTSSDGLGAFVAAGMGMSRSASKTTETSSLAESLRTNTTAQATATTSSSSASALITTPPISGNYTLSFTGDCWQQWSAYWSANSSASRAWTNIQVGMTTTKLFTDYSYDFTSSVISGTTTSCQINGGTVQLIYWPPASSTWINGNYSAITRNSSEKATIVTLGTTLTSPTVYVSFDSLYARDSCSLFGKTHYDQIVAITNTANLSSLYGWGRYNGLGSPASFNFTDLYVTPVPDYIYQSQPRCASSYAMFDPRRGNQLTMPANWTCPRTAPYDPILSIPMEVRDLDPDWANCIGGINGVYDPPIALTPADSIAKPTVPAGNPDTTTDAAPASTPKPTDPPVTSKPEPAKPSDTSLPENQDPEPSTGDSQTVDSSDKPATTAGKPADGELSGGTLQQPKPTSSPDAAPGSDTSDDPAANDQGNTDDGPKQQAGNDPPASNGQSSTDDHPTQPADSGPAPILDSPDNKPATTNALSVLASAEASAKGEQYPPANGANPADSDSSSDGQSPEAEPSPGNSPAHQTQAVNDPSDPEPFTGQSGPSQGSPTAMVASLQGGGSATIKQAGESIIIAQDGLSAAVTQGGAATIGTHVYSAAPGGGAVVVDSSATHFIGAQAGPVAEATSLTVNGQVITASRQGNGVILADATQTITAQPGSLQIFGSQTVQINSEGAELAIGTATFAIPNKAMQSAAESTAVWTKDGSTFTAISQGSSIILEAPDATITMSPGTVATFAGEQISVASAGGILVHGGQTASFKSADTNGASNDEAHVVSADGDSVVIQEGSRTLTMSAGQATVIDGKTLSAASTGGAVVMVDGGRTSTLSKQATSDDEVVASADGSSIIVKDGNRTLTLTPGQTTVVGGKTFIAQASGSAMVVAEDDATSTVPVQTTEDSSSESATGTSSTGLDPTETSSSSETDAASSDSAAGQLPSGASLAGSVAGSAMLLMLIL
ncbi:hypothetical protein WHR41_06517 [Cladosporium halotolerans]|uniref:Uncharacterized protein n=1 Tax=Cladosporium halotolerans TaxID=1052096 RepID=A0AB34KLX6_9PEZI